MEEKDLIAKIELLKEVRPQEDWMVSCRSRLAFRIEMARKKNLLNKDFFALKELFSFWRDFEPRTGFRWAYASAITLIIVLSGGSLTALAAMKSLPGSPLYQVKIALDRVRLAMVFSGDERIKLQAEIASQRINELRGVVVGTGSIESKQEKVVEVFSQIEKQLAGLDSQLPSNGGVESRQTVKTAKIVNEKMGQIEKALSEVKQNIPQGVQQNIGNKISAIAETADKTSGKALEIIADKQDDPTTIKETLAKVGEKIQDAKEKVKIISEQANNQDASSDSSIIKAVLVEKAQELLEQAEVSWQKEDASSAIKTVNIAKEIVKGAEKIDGNSQKTTNIETGKAQNSASSDKQNASSSPINSVK